ncbi:hypothetical protein Psi02_75080 [Planotetraspora silvatica]|uniref:Fibronectin type-III domain-containing protein n=1 Tax=Planotetraspora silvatica TaxID=234614 RepID=A0A8J3USF0_9ACTN|nr:hypothetical protein [Planotetraspora silvatica]GII51084.1 hypothetical protein Psi02_75080 [Planotetraspora silvatica]
MIGRSAVPVLLAVTVGGGTAYGIATPAVAERVPSAFSQVPPAKPYPPQPVDREAPTAPVLSLTQVGPSAIRLDWTPATDNVGVTAYEIFISTSPFRLLATVDGDVLTYLDHRGPDVTVSYFVKARDAAGNVSPRSNIVTRPARDVEPALDHDSDDHLVVQAGAPLGDTADDTADDEAEGRDDSRDEAHGGRSDSFGDSDGDGGVAGHGPGHGPGGGSWDDGPAGEGHGLGAPGNGQAVPAGEQADGQLPYTGAPVATIAGVAAALLVLGLAGMKIVTRRRRSADGE